MPLSRPPAPPAQSAGSLPAREETASDLPLDVIFELLSNQRRRYILHYLRSVSAHTTLGDLAEYIAGLENDKPVDALTSAERKRVYVCLYQSHLPKMDDASVIDFDMARKTVDAGPNMGQLTYFLTGLDGGSEDEPWGLVQAVADLRKATAQRLRIR